MCGAFATNSPFLLNNAQLKSILSLILIDCAVFFKTTPICSATEKNKLLKISSISGEGFLFDENNLFFDFIFFLLKIKSPEGIFSIIQFSSRKIVVLKSQKTAGPEITLFFNKEQLLNFPIFFHFPSI